MAVYQEICENCAKSVQNLYCSCNIYSDPSDYLTSLAEASDYPPDSEICCCIKNRPYPRAYPIKCCQPIVKRKKIEENYINGELYSQVEEEYIAQYCSAKKECVELKYPPKRLPRFASLPKYLRIDDDDEESNDDEYKDQLRWRLGVKPKRRNKRNSKSGQKYFC
ncbi:hypothetical protein Aperf_G00000105737 [Anoplocephala perfoliata]